MYSLMGSMASYRRLLKTGIEHKMRNVNSLKTQLCLFLTIAFNPLRYLERYVYLKAGINENPDLEQFCLQNDLNPKRLNWKF